MEMNHEYASKGVAGAGLGTGIAGLSLGVLNAAGGLGALSGLWGNGRTYNNAGNDLASAILAAALVRGDCGYGDRGYRNYGGCGGDCAPVTQKELEMAQEIAALKTQGALKDANIVTDQKSLELYKYIDGRLREIEAGMAKQDVQNQANKDSFLLLQQQMRSDKEELQKEISCERAARKCADDTIVNYVNSTFYAESIADVTTGTTTTQAQKYNPLPACTCDCGR